MCAGTGNRHKTHNFFSAYYIFPRKFSSAVALQQIHPVEPASMSVIDL